MERGHSRDGEGALVSTWFFDAMRLKKFVGCWKVKVMPRWIGRVDDDFLLLLLLFLFSSIDDPPCRSFISYEDFVFSSKFLILLLFVISAQSRIGNKLGF